MRMTQFIGLTKAANDFVSQLKPIESNNYTMGMFEEKIPLRKWKDVVERVYNEVVQDSPWSSGPVIFCCLECEGKPLFEWVQDEEVRGREVDYETGRYYV